MMKNIQLRNFRGLVSRRGFHLPVILSLALCHPFVPLSAVDDQADGWYLDGRPVIEGTADKDGEFYFGHKLTITNGMASGAESWSDGKCGGTYTGSMTWTPPPAYMKPGSKINFSMTAKTTAKNSCGSKSIGSGGWLKAEGRTIVKALDESSPSAGGTYIVPIGSPGSKLQMWVTVGVANQHGIVYYNYIYRSAGSSPTTGPSPTTVPQKADAEDPPPGPLAEKLPILTGENTEAFITRVSNNPIYVSADPTDLPPSQRKWVKIMPGKYDQKNNVICVGKNWTVRTTAGSEAVVIWKTTYSVRLEGKSWFDVEKPWEKERNKLSSWESNKRIMHALYEGIAYYYGPGPGMSGPPPRGDAPIHAPVIKLRNMAIREKGTIFIAGVTEQTDTVKSIEGQIEVLHVLTGATQTLNPGQQVKATASGLGNVSTFDLAAEKNKRSRYQNEIKDLNSRIGEFVRR